MKRITLLTAAVLAFASPGITARAADNAGQYYSLSEQTNFHASTIIGSRVYATKDAISADTAMEKPGTNWDDIGEVNNIVIGRDGAFRAVVIGVGGFIGIGEKNVAVKMSELKFLKKTGDEASNYFIIVKSNKEGLEKAPEYRAAAKIGSRRPRRH